MGTKQSLNASLISQGYYLDEAPVCALNSSAGWPGKKIHQPVGQEKINSSAGWAGKKNQHEFSARAPPPNH